jgi:hypothetical protein
MPFGPKSCPTPLTISNTCEIFSLTMLACSFSLHSSRPSSLPMTILIARLQPDYERIVVSEEEMRKMEFTDEAILEAIREARA